MDEKRSGARWASCLKGQVKSFKGGPIDCLIRDFSSEGARIEVSGTAVLPETIDLYFPLKQATYRARVRWQKENEVGVTFEAPETVAPTDPVQAQLVQRLLEVEAENFELRFEAAQLRHQIEQISAGDIVIRR